MLVHITQRCIYYYFILTLKLTLKKEQILARRVAVDICLFFASILHLFAFVCITLDVILRLKTRFFHTVSSCNTFSSFLLCVLFFLLVIAGTAASRIILLKFCGFVFRNTLCFYCKKFYSRIFTVKM